MPLKLLSQRAPVFPCSVAGRFERGEARIEILIDKEGKTCLPRIVSATDPAFGYAAMQAVIDWRFEPPKAGGKPAVVRVQAPFEFELKAGSENPAASPALSSNNSGEAKSP